MRAHPETIVSSPAWRPVPISPDGRPVVLVAVDPLDVSLFGAGQFMRVLARTTDEAIRVLERDRPRLVAVDLDLIDVDGLAVCRSASGASVLVMTGSPDRVPPALKNGCQAVLLKPFAPNLLATRIGRLLRERAQHATAFGARNGDEGCGTNRVWPETRCPRCSAPGAVSFDFSSYRRMWYACLPCEAVWLGKRQE
jgi:DNA-binding response OmpR family regulator